jgi:hypothetical protein
MSLSLLRGITQAPPKQATILASSRCGMFMAVHLFTRQNILLDKLTLNITVFRNVIRFTLVDRN